MLYKRKRIYLEDYYIVPYECIADVLENERYSAIHITQSQEVIDDVADVNQKRSLFSGFYKMSDDGYYHDIIFKIPPSEKIKFILKYGSISPIEFVVAPFHYDINT